MPAAVLAPMGEMGGLVDQAGAQSPMYRAFFILIQSRAVSQRPFENISKGPFKPQCQRKTVCFVQQGTAETQQGGECC